MINYPIDFKENAFNHRKIINKFINNDISPTDFKKYLSSMGIYAEKSGSTYMARVRNTAGMVSLEQLKKVSELIYKYSESYIHLTTRQDIQFHNLTLVDTADFLEELTQVNLFTRGTGGNCARNVACSALSGFSEDGIFDVREFALNTAKFLIINTDYFYLPRKFKISFSDSAADTAYATISDLGFIAKIKDNQKGFEVYAAGGLGLNPNAAIKIKDFIREDDYIYHVQAMAELFSNEGDRENRNKARSRYILKRLGEEKFLSLYESYLEKAKQEKNLAAIYKADIRLQEGNRHFSFIRPENGNLKFEQLSKIVDFIEKLDYKPTIVLANSQSLYVLGLNSKDKTDFDALMDDLTGVYDFFNSISCVGASVCTSGICKSSELLNQIINRFKNENSEIKNALPKIHISGCLNSCGQHQIAKIGLSGKLKNIKGQKAEYYTVYTGGVLFSGKTKLGESIGELSAKQVPDFLFEVAKLKISSGIDDFDTFLLTKEKEILQLIQEF